MASTARCVEEPRGLRAGPAFCCSSEDVPDRTTGEPAREPEHEPARVATSDWEGRGITAFSGVVIRQEAAVAAGMSLPEASRNVRAWNSPVPRIETCTMKKQDS